MRPLGEVKLKEKNGRRYRENARVRRPSRCAVRRVRSYGGARRRPHPAKKQLEGHTHHNANRPRPRPLRHSRHRRGAGEDGGDERAGSSGVSQCTVPEALEYINTSRRTLGMHVPQKLEATLEAKRRLENEQRFALLAKKDVMRTGETTSAHKRWGAGAHEKGRSSAQATRTDRPAGCEGR